MSGDYGLAEINSIADANAAWDSFFGRFFSSEIPEGVDVSFDPTLRQFAPRKNKNAKYQSPFSPKKVEAITAGEKTLHSDDFDDFLNGNIITIPERITLTKEGLAQVASAIQSGDFANESLMTEEHTFYALWLFKQNKITRQQMTTILDRAQFPQDYPIEKTYKILDESGNFTEEAKRFLIPVIKKNAFGGECTQWHIDRLHLLIRALPKSEQIFYLSKPNPNIIAEESAPKQLGNALFRNRSWYRVTDEEGLHEFHMSFGTIEALQIAVSGINGAAASRAKLGKVGIDAVKEGIEYNYRPTAISMRNSGVETTTKGIHDYVDSPMPAVTSHDVFHARLHNTIRPEFHMMLNHMNQVIAKHTKQKWSKTMWELVDREFHAFQYEKVNLSSAKDGAKRFVEMLHPKDGDRAYLFNCKTFGELSDDGFAIVWNMVHQKEVWQRLYKIDVDAFGIPDEADEQTTDALGSEEKETQFMAFRYRYIIEKMKDFKEVVGSEHQYSEILALKYRLFTAMINKTAFQMMCKLLDSLSETLINGQEQKLVFGKYQQDDTKNLTALKFGKEVIVTKNAAKKLIPTLINMEIISQLGDKDDDAVQREVKKVVKEFRSTYQGSKFSQELLNSSIANLSSINQQLEFLEACYEEIIHSQGYVRRHETMDKMFAFFKNPLTTSQRQHIALLKEKRNELLRTHLDTVSEDKKEILQWCLKERGSNLSLCKIERFYLHWDSTIPSAQEIRP